MEQRQAEVAALLERANDPDDPYNGACGISPDALRSVVQEHAGPES